MPAEASGAPTKRQKCRIRRPGSPKNRAPNGAQLWMDPNAISIAYGAVKRQGAKPKPVPKLPLPVSAGVAAQEPQRQKTSAPTRTELELAEQRSTGRRQLEKRLADLEAEIVRAGDGLGMGEAST